MRRLLLLAALAGCTSEVAGNACASDADCFNGFTCQQGACVAVTDGAGPADGAPGPDGARGDAAPPGADATGPVADAEGADPDADGPKADATGPETDAEGERPDAEGPSGDAEGPHADASGPGPDATDPGGDATEPDRDAADPGRDAAGPGQDATEPGPDATDPQPDAAEPPVCLPPAPDFPCGLNGRGTAAAVCDGDTWVPGPRCDDPDVCTDNTTGARECGVRPAELEDTRCEAGQWAAAGPCEDRLCGPAATVAVLGETVAPEAAIRSEVGSCGGAGLERAFTFTAPERHRYRFSTEGLSYGAALYLRETCEAPTPELVCARGPRGTPPEAELEMAQGQSVSVIVDALGAHGGEIPLQITDLCTTGESIETFRADSLVPSNGFTSFAYGEGEFGVAQYVAGPNFQDLVMFGRFALDGTPLSEPIRVSREQGRLNRVVWTGTRYVVIFLDQTRFPRLRYVAFDPLDPDGQPLDETVIPVIEPPPGVQYDAGRFDVAWDGQHLYVVYYLGSPAGLYLQRLDPDGRPVGAPVSLAGPAFGTDDPAVALWPEGLAVFYHSGNETPTLRRFDRQGAPLDAPVPLVPQPDRSRAGDVAITGDVIAAAYNTVTANGTAARVRLVGTDGRDIADVPLDDHGFGSFFPAIGAVPGAFGVAWLDARDPDGHQVWFRTLSPAGELGPGEVQLSHRVQNPFYLAVDGVGEDFAVQWWTSQVYDLTHVRGPLACRP